MLNIEYKHFLKPVGYVQGYLKNVTDIAIKDTGIAVLCNNKEHFFEYNGKYRGIKISRLENTRIVLIDSRTKRIRI